MNELDMSRRNIPSDTLCFTDMPELNDLLLKLRKVRLRIASSSMAPTLRPGDEVAVNPVAKEVLQTGDLVLFRHNGQLICHRLIELSPTVLCTRGDATQGPGEHIAWDQVLGKVVDIRKRDVWTGLKAGLQAAFMPSAIRWVAWLQNFKAYGWLAQPIASPFLSYHLGVPQGAYRHRWQRVDSPAELPRLEPATRPHLLMARRGARVAGWASLVFAHPAWRCEHISVRIRYRRLGIETSLARWAALLFETHSRADA